MDSSQPSSPVSPTSAGATPNQAPSEPLANPSEPPPTLSKNAQKRLLKEKRREEFKLERRAREKAAKAAKKAAKREQAAEAAEAAEAAGVEDVNAIRMRGDGGGDSGDGDSGPATKKRKLVDGEALVVRGDGEGSGSPDAKTTVKHIRKKPFGAKIVIDLGFDEKMTDREIISMVSQCAYCYSSNRKSSHPFSALLFTSLNGRTKARLDMLGTYQNWKAVEWWEEGYDALWEPPAPQKIPIPQTLEASEQKDAPTPGEFVCPVTGNVGPRTRSPKESVVYLTADSNVELLELSPEETYIIGGIVDKNRYKALCETKARSQSIRTARLPIGIYLKELPTRKVLTVNQVLDILLNWVEHRDWKKALFDVMPQRKFETVGKKARRGQKGVEGEEEKEWDTQDEEMDETGEATLVYGPMSVDDSKVKAL